MIFLYKCPTVDDDDSLKAFVFTTKKGDNDCLKMTTLTPLSSVACFIMTWNGIYFVTSFRSLVHKAQIRIENVLTLYRCDEFPKEELSQNQLQSKHIQMLD
ncbi:MAG: hypothetical protein WCF23_16740 [Candidatus Nitrosopolaris sp.]